MKACAAVAAAVPMVAMNSNQASASVLPPPSGLHATGVWQHSFQVRWHSVRGASRYGVRVFHNRALVRQWSVRGTVANVGSIKSGTHYQVFIRTNATGKPNAMTVVTPRPSTFGQKVAAYARTLVGDAYVYGATGPRSFDCSGLTQYVYHHFGRHLPRTADEQYRYMRHVSRPRAGDLVFFLSGGSAYHVGVYESNGSMVSAATPSQGVIYQKIWTSVVYGGW